MIRRGRGSGAGKEEGRCTHRDEGVGIAGIAWWQNARWSLEGPGGPRGRLKVATGPHARTQHTHIPRTHTVYIRRCTKRACAQTRWKRTRALQRRSRALCVCACACVRQRRNSALLWRRYYVIAFVRRKNRAFSLSLNRISRKYTGRDVILSVTLLCFDSIPRAISLQEDTHRRL